MNIAQRFKELRKVIVSETPGGGQYHGEITQAAATLVLAEVIQGSTITLDVNAKLSGDVRYPIMVEQR